LGRRTRNDVDDQPADQTVTDKIRVVLAEDQRMVLDALAALLELEGDLTVVAKAADGKAALEAVRRSKPNVFVTDIEMPELTGLEVIGQIREETATRTVVLTTFARAGYLRKALEVGASAYVLKTRPAQELADVIRRVHRGARVIDPELAAEALGEMDPLTERERQVLRLAAEGLNTETIAAALVLSPGTVRNYLSEAIDKLGAANRVEAARIARDKGWL
jgi:two-component system, NarL family, response regulator DesR